MRVYYASGSVLTSDAVANAIVAYAGALAKSQLADTIDVPLGDGLSAKMLVGPASQLLCLPELASGVVEPDSDEFVIELDRRTRLMAAPRPLTEQAPMLRHDDYE